MGTYLGRMDTEDKREPETNKLTIKQVKEAVEELRARKEKYQGYLKELDESGQTQLLLTDPEARRMNSKDGFHCCYNVQTAVDDSSHLIAEYEVTNHNTDQGLLMDVADSTKKMLGIETIEVVADKGHERRKDDERYCAKRGNEMTRKNAFTRLIMPRMTSAKRSGIPHSPKSEI